MGLDSSPFSDPQSLSPTQENWLNRCRLTTSRVIAIKERLVSRFRARGIPMPLIRDAIAAVEAEAWLSGFPHLFLPDLAEEILEHLRHKRAAMHPELAEAA